MLIHFVTIGRRYTKITECKKCHCNDCDFKGDCHCPPKRGDIAPAKCINFKLKENSNAALRKA